MNARPRAATGTPLIHLGIAVFVLMALSSIVIDDCVCWLTHGQAQNAADAGRLVWTSVPATSPEGARV
jgi:primosomal replication protein N